MGTFPLQWVYAQAMTFIGKAKETIKTAADSIADAMKVSIISCILSVVSLVIAIVALAGQRHAIA